ncbi:unnamed protein product [Clonostachys rosea]|uniref:Uncharacterized protein n=1 Tax=Bionectria ochroleuca TaxID=29856 RepID=A0ABY6V2A9_BIOOC|nr:unnamed protein product [Clonostachys rosea]
MASRTAVLTKEAPAPSPHLSQAIICNGMVYCSGSFGIDPVTKKLVGDAYEQTKQSLKNLNAILKEAGTDIQNSVEVNIFLSSMDHYANVNRAYLEVFTGTPKPARTCVAAAQLPNAEAAVEIKLVAALPDNASTGKGLSRL